MEMAGHAEKRWRVQIRVSEVELRSLDVYELAVPWGRQVIALELARQHLETLGLNQAVEILDNPLETWRPTSN